MVSVLRGTWLKEIRNWKQRKHQVWFGAGATGPWETHRTLRNEPVPSVRADGPASRPDSRQLLPLLESRESYPMTSDAFCYFLSCTVLISRSLRQRGIQGTTQETPRSEITAELPCYPQYCSYNAGSKSRLVTFENLRFSKKKKSVFQLHTPLLQKGKCLYFNWYRQKKPSQSSVWRFNRVQIRQNISCQTDGRTLVDQNQGKHMKKEVWTKLPGNQGGILSVWRPSGSTSCFRD